MCNKKNTQIFGLQRLYDEIILKSQQRFKNEAHNVYAEEFNTIALSSKDDERLQTYDGITTYRYRYKH